MKPTRCTITVASKFPAWQQGVVRILSQHYNAETGAFADERTLLEEFKKDEDVKKQMKRVMTFVAMIKVQPRRGPPWSKAMVDAKAPSKEAFLVPRPHRRSGWRSVARRRSSCRYSLTRWRRWRRTARTCSGRWTSSRLSWSPRPARRTAPSRASPCTASAESHA